MQAKAFETIFHQYYKTLVSFAMRYGLEQMEAEDVVMFYDYLLEEEVTRILYEAINTLPVQCREVISLLLAGNSVEEVAAKLNISNSSVRTYKARALERLRILLRNYPCLILMITRLMG